MSEVPGLYQYVLECSKKEKLFLFFQVGFLGSTKSSLKALLYVISGGNLKSLSKCTLRGFEGFYYPFEITLNEDGKNYISKNLVFARFEKWVDLINTCNRIQPDSVKRLWNIVENSNVDFGFSETCVEEELNEFLKSLFDFYKTTNPYYWDGLYNKLQK